MPAQRARFVRLFYSPFFYSGGLYFNILKLHIAVVANAPDLQENKKKGGFSVIPNYFHLAPTYAAAGCRL